MSRFKNMKIQKKLFLLIGILISQVIFTSVFDITQMTSIEDEYETMINGVIRRLINSADAIRDLTDLRIHNLSRVYAVAGGEQSEEFLEAYKEKEQIIASFKRNIHDLRNNVNADVRLSEQEKLIRLEILDEIYVTFVFGYAHYSTKLAAAAEKKNMNEISEIVKQGVASGNKISERLHDLRALTIQMESEKTKELKEYSASVKKTVIILTFVVIIISFLLSMRVAESIKKPISSMREAMAEISRGNLTYPIRSEFNDELGELSNHIGNMVDMIVEMNKTMAVMDYLNCMIYITDLNYNIVYINKKMAETYGISRENLVNQKCYKALKGMDSSCAYCLMPQIVADKDKAITLSYDYVWEEKLGIWLGGSARLIRWIDGSQVQLHYMSDETEKKEHEEELHKAKQDAESASLSKSDFLARMSHEIRTPMNAILGITGMMMENSSLPEDTQEALSKIYTSGDLLLSIINDILDLSKIESGKLELIPAVYQVASIINDTVYLNKIKYESKQIDFKLQVNESVPSELFGDALRIRQILNNLLSNSFKYTENGEIELSVTAESGDAKEDPVTLVLSVRDTGQGMTKEQLSKLFDEYSRFNNEANRTTEGTGLGMSIARNLIKMMEGTITVESEPNKGSLFIVRLPQRNVGSEVLGKAITENLQQSRVGDSRLKKTYIVREYMPYGSVLIVDDADMNIYVAKGLMKPYGLKIETAMSGFEAIDKIKNGNVYDIVFMDHMMPKMDGIEATRIIRELGYKNSIAALTANAVVGQADVFLSNGFDEFIPKPIDIRQLNALLNKLIRDKQPPEVIAAARKQKREQLLLTSNGNGEISSDFLSNLGKISDVNTEIGLSRFSGIEDMYHETMKVFYKKLMTECNNMSSYLDNKDLNNFSILIHAMKSSLSTIGAMGLSEAALKLEIASKNDDMDYCVESFPPIKEKLLSLHEQLSAFLQEAKNDTPKKRESDAFLRENAQKALDASNTLEYDDCEEAINKLLACDFGEQINNLLQKAMDALSDFKCGEASKILKEILGEQEISI